jgi:hypothetical protein
MLKEAFRTFTKIFFSLTFEYTLCTSFTHSTHLQRTLVPQQHPRPTQTTTASTYTDSTAGNNPTNPRPPQPCNHSKHLSHSSYSPFSHIHTLPPSFNSHLLTLKDTHKFPNTLTTDHAHPHSPQYTLSNLFLLPTPLIPPRLG